MKRFLSIVAALILLLSMLPVTDVFAATTETVYLDPVKGNDSNTGLTEASPVKTLGAAYDLLKAAGGTLVFLDTLSLTGDTVFPACSHPVTITSKTGSEGIASSGHITFNGETTLTNLTLTLSKASSATNIGGGGHKLTVDTGVNCVPFVNSTDTYYFCLQGGSHEADVASTELIVKSGTWRNLYMGAYTKAVTGNAKLTMTGGTVSILTPSYSKSVGGNVEMHLSGTATVSNTLFAGCWSSGNIGGDVTVTLGKGATVTSAFSAGNGTGNIDGITTYIYDGYEAPITTLSGKGNTAHKGTLGGSRLLLKSGLFHNFQPNFTDVDIAIEQGRP